jgi:hypothetical protein
MTLPSTKPPFNIRPGWILAGIIAVMMIGAGGSSKNATTTPRAEPVQLAEPRTTSEGYLVEEEDIRVRTAVMLGVYVNECGGKLPPALDAGASAIVEAAGIAKTKQHIDKVYKVLAEQGRGSFCIFVGRSIKGMNRI